MRKATSVIAIILLVAVGVSFGEETAFNGCKLADVKGKQAEARLIFSDDAKSVIVRSLDRDIAKFRTPTSTRFHTTMRRNTGSHKVPS